MANDKWKFLLLLALLPWKKIVHANENGDTAYVDSSLTSNPEVDSLLNTVFLAHGYHPQYFQDYTKVAEKDSSLVVRVADCDSFEGGRSNELILLFNRCDDQDILSEDNTLPIYLINIFLEDNPCLKRTFDLWVNRVSGRSSALENDQSLNLSILQEFTSCLKWIAPSTTKEEMGANILNGRKITIVTINRPPFLIFNMGGKDRKEIVRWKGYCIDMLDALAEKFNFTYHLILPPDGNWGVKIQNGTFNGMVGMVQRGEVEFAIASFTITYIREQVIDFTHAFYVDPTTILIPQAKAQQNLLAFTAPFSWEIWMYILVSIASVSFILWCLFSFPRPNGSRLVKYPHDRKREKPINYLRYLWDTTFTIVGQSTRMRQTESSRVLFGFWWLFSILVAFIYTGTLIAFLTVPKLQNLINSLEELGDQREILWTYRKNTAYDNLFMNAPPPGTYYKIGELMREQPNLRVATDEEGVEAVLHRKMAYIKEKSWLDNAMEKDYLKAGECRLSQVPQVFFSAGFGWVLQERSPFLPHFNDVFLRWRQMGLFEFWKRRYWPKPNECTAGKAATRAPRPLSLTDIQGHFLLLGVGILTAFLALIGECFIKEYKKFSFGGYD